MKAKNTASAQRKRLTPAMSGAAGRNTESAVSARRQRMICIVGMIESKATATKAAILAQKNPLAW